GKAEAGTAVMALRLRADACLRYAAMLMSRRCSQATSMRIHDYGRSQCGWRKLAQAQKNYRRNGPKALHVLGVVRGPTNLISVPRSTVKLIPRGPNYFAELRFLGHLPTGK